MNENKHSKYDKIVEYHYNAYRNLIKILIFLDAAGITAVMATLGLRHNPEVAHFANPKNPFEASLNLSLNFFLQVF